jgi:hypothetical protein
MEQSRDFEGDYYQAERILESRKSLNVLLRSSAFPMAFFPKSLSIKRGHARSFICERSQSLVAQK